jgi:hypothetical protein
VRGGAWRFAIWMRSTRRWSCQCLLWWAAVGQVPAQTKHGIGKWDEESASTEIIRPTNYALARGTPDFPWILAAQRAQTRQAHVKHEACKQPMQVPSFSSIVNKNLEQVSADKRFSQYCEGHSFSQANCGCIDSIFLASILVIEPATFGRSCLFTHSSRGWPCCCRVRST